MTMLSLHLKMVGTLLLSLAAAHAFFPKRFRWREELARLSLLNRQIFVVHCFFIVFVLVMFAIWCLCYTEVLRTPAPLARGVLGGMAAFWALRLVVQWFVYDRSLWRGHRFNTAAHVFFSLLWAYFASIFGWALWSVRS
jgi:hypothetical protein